MSYTIRKVQKRDISDLEKLLDAYMRETYDGAWAGTAERLEKDGLGNEFEMMVAETSGEEIVGFAAWISTYDLHWCLKGGEVIDMFVSPQHRGRGVALLMAIEVASEIQKRGGTYLKGGAVDNPVVKRFYQRIAMCLPECYVSGRAFRNLAGLSGKSVREIVRNLPETAWNYEP
jgi:GNAT superfamily N-acetyltransferase